MWAEGGVHEWVRGGRALGEPRVGSPFVLRGFTGEDDVIGCVCEDPECGGENGREGGGEPAGGEKGNGVQQGRVTSCSRATCTEGQPRLLSLAGQELGLAPALPSPLPHPH